MNLLSLHGVRCFCVIFNVVIFTESELTPYLNELMSYLMTALKTTEEVWLKELIISALAATGRL